MRGAKPLSIIVDDLGIYYDATRPSRLERMLTSDDEFPEDELERGEAELQKLTDRYIEEVAELGKKKEHEIMEV